MTLQLLILAVVAMAALAVLRVIRVRSGRTPHPDGRARIPFIVACLFVPPILASVLTGSGGAVSVMRGIGSVLPYMVLVGGVSILMAIVAPFVGLLAPRSVRPMVVLALSARESDPDDLPFNPPVTAELATSMASVDRANGVFPRGPEFPSQIKRDGFRYAWDELDSATKTLEGRIADDRRLGLPVAAAARALAADARSRLETLQRLFVDSGQVWAT
jgi:hypothetical protein